MTKTTLLTKLLMVLVATVTLDSIAGRDTDLVRLSPTAMAIQRKLCTPEGQPDDVARQFFDCYQESVTPGGSKLLECQEQVYRVQMMDGKKIEQVCASMEKLPKYAGCVMRKLLTSGHRPSETMNKLNECQGAVLGVPALSTLLTPSSGEGIDTDNADLPIVL